MDGEALSRATTSTVVDRVEDGKISFGKSRRSYSKDRSPARPTDSVIPNEQEIVKEPGRLADPINGGGRKSAEPSRQREIIRREATPRPSIRTPAPVKSELRSPSLKWSSEERLSMERGRASMDHRRPGAVKQTSPSPHREVLVIRPTPTRGNSISRTPMLSSTLSSQVSFTADCRRRDLTLHRAQSEDCVGLSRMARQPLTLEPPGAGTRHPYTQIARVASLAKAGQDPSRVGDRGLRVPSAQSPQETSAGKARPGSPSESLHVYPPTPNPSLETASVATSRSDYSASTDTEVGHSSGDTVAPLSAMCATSRVSPAVLYRRGTRSLDLRPEPSVRKLSRDDEEEHRDSDVDPETSLKGAIGRFDAVWPGKQRGRPL